MNKFNISGFNLSYKNATEVTGVLFPALDAVSVPCQYVTYNTVVSNHGCTGDACNTVLCLGMQLERDMTSLRPCLSSQPPVEHRFPLSEEKNHPKF